MSLEEKPTINVLWVIDHVCYDGSLHGGGRLYWNVVPRFDRSRFRIIPCMLRANDTIRRLFTRSPVPVRILDKGKFDPTTLGTFLRLIREEDIHVMHLHCYGSSTFGRLASLVTGVPAIIHDYDTEVYFPYPWYLGLMDQALARITPAAVAASPMVREFLMKKRNIGRERIHMMFHAVPPEMYGRVRESKLRALRASLQADDRTRIVGTFTKLGPQRGNEYLLKAAAEALRELPGMLFLIIYKPTYFHRLPNRQYVPVSRTHTEAQIEHLESLASDCGIGNNVRFVEWPETVEPWIALCDLVVAPFLSERFSSVHLLEAMAKGKPLIATDLGEQREVIQHGVNGYRVRPGDSGELAQRIVGILDQPEELERLGRNARATAEQYSVDAYVGNLQNLYREMIEQAHFSEDSNAEVVR